MHSDYSSILYRFFDRFDIDRDWLCDRHGETTVGLVEEQGLIESTPGTRGMVSNLTSKGEDYLSTPDNN